MATPLYEAKKVHDLVLSEVDQRLSRTSATFKNNTVAIASFKVGQTLIAGGVGDEGTKVPAPAGDADSVLLTDLVNVPIDGEVKVPIMKSGPCILNQDELEYIAGVDATEAGTQRADLIALGIQMVREPLKQGDAADVLT